LKSILAIVVLYRMSPQQSPACAALVHAMQAGPAAAAMDLVIADNSPQAQPAPPLAHYLHDGRNPGLAERYNYALHLAQQAGATWLLVFDQDTTPTPGYFAELLHLAAALADDASIAIVVPKLTTQGRIMSPHLPGYRRAGYVVGPSSTGVLGDWLAAFNSGAMLRVSALQGIGGFPASYPLDYLDHATMHRLQQAGGKMYVMQSAMEHDLSENRTHRPPNLDRLLGRLRAEERFFAEHSSWFTLLRHRFDLLRQSVGHARRGRFTQAGLRLRALFHLP
jgi:GT2 family glycosyltransferase